MTVRQLLNHTSGIPDYFDDADWFINIWKEEKRVPGNDEILRFLCETKAQPYFAPGEGLEYSNTGFNLLALLVERRSGVPYEEFLQKNIFDPAGMTATHCCHIRRDGVPIENYAQATVFDHGKCVADVDSEEDGDVVAFDGLNGDDDGDEMEFMLYPIGENEFGRKSGMIRLKFGEEGLTYLGMTCKKL